MINQKKNEENEKEEVKKEEDESDHLKFSLHEFVSKHGIVCLWCLTSTLYAY